MFFREPSTICSAGSSSANATGDGLWLARAEGEPLALITDLQAPPAAPWLKGKCFPTMGVHYWYVFVLSTIRPFARLCVRCTLLTRFLAYTSGVLRIPTELEQVQPEHFDGLHGHFPGVFTLQRRHAERMGLGLRVSPPRERRRPLGEPLRCPSGLAAIAHSSCSLWPKHAALAEESGCGAVGSVPSGLGAASRANPFRASEACASACSMRGALALISGQQTKIFTQPAFQPTCLSNMKQISTIHVAHNNPKTTLFC